MDLEQIVTAFEAAYKKSQHVDLAGFLPAEEHPQFQQIAVELIRCDMELSWQGNENRRLDDYRKRFPGVLQNYQNLDQVAFEEYRLRTQAGESTSPQEYEQKYQIKTHHWPDLRDMPVDSRDGESEGVQKPLLLEVDEQNDESKPDFTSRLGSSNGLSDLTTVESRLHRRLRFIGLTFSILLIYFALLVAFNPAQKMGLFLGSSFLVGLNATCLFACVLVTILLWIRKSISLNQLRVFEIILFGLVLMELTTGLYSDLFIDHELRNLLLDDHSLFHYSSSWSLPFFALIIGYGTLVPSSWLRCTVVVSIIALTPLVICTTAADMEHGLNQIFFRSFLLQMVMWMCMAAAIAIYGVHRLETIERRLLRSGNLGKYRLIRKLGSGGMASIYLAEDTLLQRPCAVKLMLQHRANDPQLFSRFEREVNVLAAISHSNIVQIFDVGNTQGGVFYYVMEYLEGPTIEELVRRKRRSDTADVVDFLQQTCAALKKVHQHGLVHRDVKPSNIIACNSEDRTIYKLLDFGLVKTACLEADSDHLTQDGAIIGTPAFMSPEQASGTPLDIRSDIYSLGTVAYFLLIGRPPFEKNSVVETLSAHIHEKPPSVHQVRPEISANLSAVVSKCLVKDPNGRFANASELESALKLVSD